MNVTAPRLENAIRLHLAPMLRREGFVGSGRTFRHVVDEAVHVANVQAFYYGGRFAINLAVHPLGLPYVWSSTSADPKKITEEKCEFRDRLSEGTGDQVWDHDGTAEGMSAAVANAADLFQRRGPLFYRQFSGPNSLFRTLTVAALDAQAEALRLYCSGSSIRLAYTFARLRKLQGLRQEAAAFAQWALSQGAQPPFEGYEELCILANDA